MEIRGIIKKVLPEHRAAAEGHRKAMPLQVSQTTTNEIKEQVKNIEV